MSLLTRLLLSYSYICGRTFLKSKPKYILIIHSSCGKLWIKVLNIKIKLIKSPCLLHPGPVWRNDMSPK